MKKITLYIYATLLSCSSVLAQPVDSLLSKYVNATGGSQLYDSIETFSVNVSSDDSKVPYDQTISISEKGGKVLKVRNVLGRKFMYKLDGNDGTLYIPTGGLNRASTYQTQGLSDFEKMKLKEELQSGLFAFINYANKGYAIKLKGNVKVGSINATQVEVSNKEVTRNYFFNQTTFLLVKEDLTYANGEKIEMLYSDYKTTDFGIKYPSKGTLIESGKSKNVDIEISLNNVSPAVFEIK